MRGTERVRVAVVLVVAGAASAALVGFGSGVAAAALGVPPAPAVVVASMGLVAALLDAARDQPRVPRPPSIRRQVPTAWSVLFRPVTVAGLYGARLGVGPLTVLTTWLWWAAALSAASLGAGAATAVGALFGGARAVVVLVAGVRASPSTMPARAAAILRAERPVTAAVVLLAGVAVGAVVAP